MSGRRLLIVGSGGREHALAWKARQSPEIDRLFVAPGNSGTGSIAENVPVAATDIPQLVSLVEEREIDLTIVGPEAPLALGLADALLARGRAVFGPTAAAARIEASKAFGKEVLTRAGVPTASYAVFERADAAMAYLARAVYPLVVKADSLAAGKGVTVCAGIDVARTAVRRLMVERVLGPAGDRVLIEEALHGPEVSLLALVDGDTVVPLPLARDHKRLGNGDTGPNTGGMGAFAPVAGIDEDERNRLVDTILRPVTAALHAMGIPYRGVLYAGLMLTPDGPRVLEFNCRLGDPEAQVILPLLAGDLLPWLDAVARGDLRHAPVTMPLTGESAVGVTLAAPGYPDAPRPGAVVDGLDQVPDDVLVFHAATATTATGSVVTTGGRVATVVGRGATLAQARQRAYSTPIRFPDLQMRSDIAQAAGRRFRLGILASGEGSNLQALLDACADGRLDATPAVVVSAAPSTGALDRARRAEVAALALPFTGDRRDSRARSAYDRRLLDLLRPFDLDLLVLAGWMYVLSPEFLDACPFPAINVHPAILANDGGETVEIDGHVIPVLRGLRAVERAVSLGLPLTGVTVHHVTPAVDAGPVVVHETVAIEANEPAEALYARIKPLEHRLLVDAVRLVLSHP